MNQIKSVNDYIETGFYVVLGLLALAGIVRAIWLGI